MSLYKRPDSEEWWINIRHDGKRIRRTTGTSNKAEAQEFHDRLKAQLWRQNKLQELPQRTWNDAVKRWLLENPSLRSLDDRKDQLRWLTQFLEGVPLNRITRDTGEDLIARKLAEPAMRGGGKGRPSKPTGKTCSPSTVNRHTAALSAVLNDAVEWGWLTSAPKLRKLGEPDGIVRFLTREEVVRLIAELPDHLADAAALSLTIGQRMSNVLHMPWRQVDLQRGVAWVLGEDSKNGKAVSVPLNGEAVAVLRGIREAQVRAEAAAQLADLPALRAAHQFVFTYRGRPITGGASTAAWGKAKKRAGIKNFRWHDWRHTFASWHTMSGTPKEVIQQLGNWKDSKMVERYAHLAPGYVAQFAGNMKPYDGHEIDNEIKKEATG